jgi:hypothetical protein
MDFSRGFPEFQLGFRQPPSFSIEALLLSTRSLALPSNEPEALNQSAPTPTTLNDRRRVTAAGNLYG